MKSFRLYKPVCTACGSKNNRKFQFGLINIYAEENGFRESGSKIVQVGILNFRNGTFCPFVLW